MIKIADIEQGRLDGPLVQMMPVSDRGLIGADRKRFAKRASASILDTFDHLKFASGEIPIHMFAMGSTETVSANRNGDGFRKSALQRFHDTFVKYARLYREHANRDPSKSYGIVKASAFNEPMGRVELICALNGTKEAAQRNGGLLADRELTKLASGKPFGVSMSCSVAHDVCSSCGNKAASRIEYCDEPAYGGHCKAGGLRRNIGKVCADGHHLHADNPEPRFFDISHVDSPADRIAYVTGQLEKTASRRQTLLEPEVVFGLVPPLSLLQDGQLLTTKMAKTLRWLSALSSWEHSGSVSMAKAAQVCGSVRTIVSAPTGNSPATVCRALVDAGCVLPLAGFLQVFANQSEKSATDITNRVGPQLATCFSQLLASGDIVERLRANPFVAGNVTTRSLQKWANSLVSGYALTESAARQRSIDQVIHSAIPQSWPSAPLEKSAASQNLIQQFACYQAAAITDIFNQNVDIPLTASLVVVQNQLR